METSFFLFFILFFEIKNKKSGNWGLDEIDCHRSHKGQCTSEKENLRRKKMMYIDSFFQSLFPNSFSEFISQIHFPNSFSEFSFPSSKQNNISKHCTKS